MLFEVHRELIWTTCWKIQRLPWANRGGGGNRPARCTILAHNPPFLCQSSVPLCNSGIAFSSSLAIQGFNLGIHLALKLRFDTFLQFRDCKEMPSCAPFPHVICDPFVIYSFKNSVSQSNFSSPQLLVHFLFFNFFYLDLYARLPSLSRGPKVGHNQHLKYIIYVTKYNIHVKTS